MVIHVQGGWPSSFVFQITSARFELYMRFLQQPRYSHLPRVFAPTSYLSCPTVLQGDWERARGHSPCFFENFWERKFLLPRSATSPWTWVHALDGGCGTLLSEFFFGASSSRMVRFHGMSLWIPCGENWERMKTIFCLDHNVGRNSWCWENNDVSS